MHWIKENIWVAFHQTRSLPLPGSWKTGKRKTGNHAVWLWCSALCICMFLKKVRLGAYRFITGGGGMASIFDFSFISLFYGKFSVIFSIARNKTDGCVLDVRGRRNRHTFSYFPGNKKTLMASLTQSCSPAIWINICTEQEDKTEKIFLYSFFAINVLQLMNDEYISFCCLSK